jgi:hypothetical protein
VNISGMRLGDYPSSGSHPHPLLRRCAGKLFCFDA